MRQKMLRNTIGKGLPLSTSLNPPLPSANFQTTRARSKTRILRIAGLAVLIAVCISCVAKILVHLIDLITNLSFQGTLSLAPSNPATHTYGAWVIVVPVIGGLIVGVMALYGSKAIRGHGIPEAIEQILTNHSKIKPSITILKPVSAAISIGTGGPFGAEGPIIATGGALGSTLGQLLEITHNERKILLAAGATAGMSAIFGSPIAAIFLAIELLLFEFSPRSIIPVALACITGAAGHHFLFSPEVVFPVQQPLLPASNSAIGFYSLMGIFIGLFSVFVTKLIYLIEDGFEKLPIHWAWWPALGGVAVGVIGWFAPRTLGVGYYNITDLLSGTLTISVVLSLCVLKFVSWAISLGSGTSGGTLAPLLTIGGAAGALFGSLVISWFPLSGVTIPLAALVGMAALFAGASRAFLTSILFALETTGQYNALLPLLATCTAAYFVSYFIMENTIMTEKIARRGVRTPYSYEPEVLENVMVENVFNSADLVASEDKSITEIQTWLNQSQGERSNYVIVSDEAGAFKGTLHVSNLFSPEHSPDVQIGSLLKPSVTYIQMDDTLVTALKTMVKEKVDVLPVLSREGERIIGLLSYQDIFSAYKQGLDNHEMKQPPISLKKRRLKMVLRSKKLASRLKKRDK